MDNFKILIKSALQMAAENRFLPPDKIKILETIEPNVREFEITREFESDRELEPESSETIESSEITESEISKSEKKSDLNNNNDVSDNISIPVLLSMITDNEKELRNLRSIVDRHECLLRKLKKVLEDQVEEPETVE